MPKSKGKTMSIERSKKSFITLMDALGPEVLSTLVPGAGLVYKLSEVLITHAWEFHVDRNKDRIHEFHRALLDGTDVKDFKSFVSKQFSIEDYYTLLDSAVHDQEEAKIPIYSRFLKALIKQSVQEKYKIHLIKALKELTCSDVDLLRKIYISSKHDFVGKGGKSKQIKQIVKIEDPLRFCTMQTLMRLGFIAQGLNNTEAPIPTEILEAFINATFDQADLTPEVIGERAWKEIGYVFIVFPNEKCTDQILFLQKILTDLNIRSSNTLAQKGEPHVNVIMSADILIVCLDTEAGEKDSAMSFYINHPLIRKKKIIKILLSASPDGAGLDPFPDLQASASFNFVSKDSYETHEFMEFIKGVTG